MQVKQEPEDPPNSSSSRSQHHDSANSGNHGGILKRQQTPAFLEKLFDILEDENDFHHLISWQPDGNSFIIKKVNEFSEIVLPKYFKHSNIQSYIRQLNMYGFSKTRHDSNHHEFTHKLFQRGRRDLLPFIRRKTQNSATSSAAVAGGKGGAPNFSLLQFSGAKLVKGAKKLPHALGLLPTSLPTAVNASNSANAPPNNLANISSEASSNGVDDDMHEYVVHAGNLPFTASPEILHSGTGSGGGGEKIDLEQKVDILGRQVTALTELSLALMQKHDDLCEALQYYMEQANQKRGGSHYRTESPHSMNFVSDQSNGNDSSSSSGNSDSGGGRNSGRGNKNDQLSESSLRDIDEGGPPLKRLKSLDGGISTNNSTSFIGSGNDDGEMREEGDTEAKSAQKRPREGSDSSSRKVNFLDYQSQKLAEKLPSFPTDPHTLLSPSSLAVAVAGQPLKKRSFSLDLGGLEAITAAAQFLDDSGSPESKKREVNWDSYSSVLLARGNAGGALTKSISYGYEYSLLQTKANLGDRSS